MRFPKDYTQTDEDPKSSVPVMKMVEQSITTECYDEGQVIDNSANCRRRKCNDAAED